MAGNNSTILAIGAADRFAGHKVSDRSFKPETAAREKANRNHGGHVAAPISGVVTLVVEEGQSVEEGEQIGTIEAMKMESALTSNGGMIERVVKSGTKVEPGDLLVALGS